MPTFLTTIEMVKYLPKTKDGEVKEENFKNIVKYSYGNATPEYINKTGGLFG